MQSIRDRLGRVLLIWSLLWTAAVAAAVWAAVRHEIDEKLDNRLRAASEVLVNVMRRAPLSAWQADKPSPAADRQDDDVEIPFTWQLVDRHGQLLQRADDAPRQPFHRAAVNDLSNSGEWRVFGRPLDADHFLYVAHERSDRMEAQLEVALSATLAALAMALIGQLWLRARMWQELQPLQTLSERLTRYHPGEGKLALGAAERVELEPLHQAVDALSERLAERIRREQGFSAHAAHALRTPLAGIDAQLSVALKEAPAELQPRLQRVRSAAQRMQHVVAALLGLFRAQGEPRREAIDLRALVADLPGSPLPVDTWQAGRLEADADLLAATLINLFDNAARHGAKRLRVSVPSAQVLRVEDDGRGLAEDRLGELERALAERDYESLPGLGLVLADVVARAHGGQAGLRALPTGFCIELRLGAPMDESGASAPNARSTAGAPPERLSP